MHDTEDNTPPDVALGHEARDISTRIVVRFGIALVVGAVIVHLAVWVVYRQFGTQATRADAVREFPLAPVGAPAQPPEPRLQTRPREELKAMRASEGERLTGYGWVNSSAGVAYIPVERAIEQTLERGLPARADAGGYRSETRPERASSGRAAIAPEK